MNQKLFNTWRSACGLPVLLLLAASASATNLYVDKSGHDYPQCGLKKISACQTIQYTIDYRAAVGDVLLIQPGYHPGPVTINKSLTLRGPLWAKAAIAGGNGNGVVIVNSGTVRLENLTILGGLAGGDEEGEWVGGIFNAGKLVLSHVTVTNNYAQTFIDQDYLPIVGGILNYGNLDIDHSTISVNGATGGCYSAGGIMNQGYLTMEDSDVSGNVISPDTNCFTGPGLVPSASGLFHFFATAIVKTTSFRGNGITSLGTLTLDRSTISGSYSDAIVNGGPLTVVNSTIAYNYGSAVSEASYDYVGTLDMSNSTVVANGGYAFDFSLPTASTIRNSIVIDNGAGACDGFLYSGGDYNVVQDSGGCYFVGGEHDIFGADPLLKPLRNYGGPTTTMDLGAGSIAIGGGNPDGCRDGNGNLLKTDQRGLPRPAPSSTRCDIGAVEAQHDGAW